MVRQLGRGQRAAARTAANRERIIAGLERIASRLRGASAISGQTGQIRRLSAAQGRSLQNLAALLRQQLEALRMNARGVRGTRTGAARVAKLSAEQARRLEEALRELARLREVSLVAGSTSAQVARLAEYGARLAEDTRRSFQ